MIKKVLMIFLLVGFIIGTFLLFKFFSSKIAPESISVPLPKIEPQPTSGLFLSPTPMVVINEIENDLVNIESDLKKVKEDTRLNPPGFLFELGLK